MKALHYETTKFVGNNKKIVVKISLADDCGNGYCYFSATCMGYEKRGGHWIDKFGGCDHERIIRYFPEFADFCRLHLSNSKGQPMYALENGLYVFRENGAKACAEYWRISEEEAEAFKNVDKLYAAFLLVKNGIYERWKAEADAAIEHLEELTGEKFEDYDESKDEIRLTDEELNIVRERVESGYYSPEQIAERTANEKKAKREKERAELVERYDKQVEKAILEKWIMLIVFDYFGTTDNVILHTHTNELAFNWTEPQFSTCKRKYTSAEFADFCAACGSKLGDITPVLKREYQF